MTALPGWVIALNVIGALMLIVLVAMYFKLELHKLDPDLLERVQVPRLAFSSEFSEIAHRYAHTYVAQDSNRRSVDPVRLS